jgi:hypothetical protein
VEGRVQDEGGLDEKEGDVPQTHNSRQYFTRHPKTPSHVSLLKERACFGGLEVTSRMPKS